MLTRSPSAPRAPVLDRPGSWARLAIRVDLAIPLGLAAAALLIRLPNLWTIPSLTDEAKEVLLGLQIARGELLPVSNIVSYLSALWNYILAALFLLFGPSAYLPRLVVLATGVLTIPATYLLARDVALAGRTPGAMPDVWPARAAGALAAALLAANGAHVLVSSHIAWSHSLAPLFATLGLWLLHRAVSRDDRRALAWAALALGLMVQAHTTTLALLPGAALYALLRRPRWLLEARVWVAGLPLLAVNANLILASLLTGAPIRGARQMSRDYADDAASGLDLYVANLGDLGLGLLRLLGGAVDVRADTTAYFRDPLIWIAAALAVAGALLATRRRDPLVVCAGLSYVLLLAYFNGKYQVVPNARFLTPLLPLLFAALALALVEPARRGRGQARPAIWGAGALALVLVGGALWSLGIRTEQLATSDVASRGIDEAVATLVANRQAGEPVALDADLKQLWLDGGGTYHMALRYHLALRGISTANVETRTPERTDEVDPCRGGRVELRRVDPTRARRAPRLLDDDPSTPAKESNEPYWLFRTIQPDDPARDARRGQVDEWSTPVATYEPPITGNTRAANRCAHSLPI